MPSIAYFYLEKVDYFKVFVVASAVFYFWFAANFEFINYQHHLVVESMDNWIEKERELMAGRNLTEYEKRKLEIMERNYNMKKEYWALQIQKMKKEMSYFGDFGNLMKNMNESMNTLKRPRPNVCEPDSPPFESPILRMVSDEDMATEKPGKPTSPPLKKVVDFGI